MELMALKEAKVKIKTFIAGNRGYLYADIIVALTVLSITVIGLFSAGRNIKETRVEIESKYNQSIEKYEGLLLDQVEK